METSASFEARYAPLLYPTNEIRWDEKAGLQRDAIRSQCFDVLEAQRIRRPAMKKVSTVQASGNQIFKEQKLTIGLDLGDRWSFYCVLDEAGKIILDSNFRKALYSGLFVNMNFEDFV
jgi:hypothetical protein